MRRFLNNSSVPLSLAVFLATDNYDYDEETISVTSLLKPLKQLVLSARVPQEMGLADIDGLVPSRLGSAIHDGIERAWLDNSSKAMIALGYPKGMVEKVLVNPEPHQLYDGCIPVYLERRSHKMIGGRKVSGKFDFVGDGRVEDFKTTSVYTWINNTKDEDYIWQGSLYRWLNPDIVTQDTMAIQFIFTDWSGAQARSDTKYPPKRVMQKVYKLKSLREAEAFVEQKIKLIDANWHLPENELPPCTDKDLWRKEAQFKYYKNPEKMSRSTKNFDNKQDAYIFMAENKNVGLVKEVPGQVVACKYCPAFPICEQAKGLIASGDLIL